MSNDLDLQVDAAWLESALGPMLPDVVTGDSKSETKNIDHDRTRAGWFMDYRLDGTRKTRGKMLFVYGGPKWDVEYRVDGRAPAAVLGLLAWLSIPIQERKDLSMNDDAQDIRCDLLRRAGISQDTVDRLKECGDTKPALDTLCEFIGEHALAAPDTNWYRDCFAQTGEHWVLTDDGWLPAAMLADAVVGHEMPEVLMEVNAPA